MSGCRRHGYCNGLDHTRGLRQLSLSRGPSYILFRPICGHRGLRPQSWWSSASTCVYVAHDHKMSTHTHNFYCMHRMSLIHGYCAGAATTPTPSWFMHCRSSPSNATPDQATQPSLHPQVCVLCSYISSETCTHTSQHTGTPPCMSNFMRVRSRLCMTR